VSFVSENHDRPDSLMKEHSSQLTTENTSIFILWLFTISGIIGMSIGYFEWFIVKTPLNLMVFFTLLLINFPIQSVKAITITFLFAIVGFTAEWIGVHTGQLFGEYRYGANLGFRFDDIPLLIGVNWAILTLATAAIAQHYLKNKWLRVPIGAAFMVSLDFFIEPSAPAFDFWYWENGHAPLQNFIAWYVIAALLHFVYVKSEVKGSFHFSLHVMLTQFTFFVYFYFYLNQ